MLYLSKLLGTTVVDSRGTTLGVLDDLIVNANELFPRITGLVFRDGEDVPAMVSWRKYVSALEDGRITLTIPREGVRFSYLQPDEILLCRDLLNKEVVDVGTMKVVRVSDVKLSGSATHFRIMGVEVGTRGALRAISPKLERFVSGLTSLVGRQVPETILPWSSIDLVVGPTDRRPLSKLHKRLSDLHPADIADVIEQLDREAGANLLDQLTDEAAAETIAELERDVQLSIFDAIPMTRAAALLALMDPDDAADIVGGLPEKTSALLAALDPASARDVVLLLGYVEGTAGSVMTPEVASVPRSVTVAEALEHLRDEAEDLEILHYVYLIDEEDRLAGVASLRDILTAEPDQVVDDIATHDLITASAEDDRREVAEAIAKYGLLAIPIVDEDRRLVGMVTVDDAFDVLEESKAEEFEIATGSTSATRSRRGIAAVAERLWWFVRRNVWVGIWAATSLVVSLLAPPTIAWRVGPSLIVLPILLILCDDIITSLKSEVVSEGEPLKTSRFWGLIGRDLAVSIGLAVLFTGVVSILFRVYFQALGLAETFRSVAYLALPSALAIPVVLLVGVFMGQSMRRTWEKDGSIAANRYSVVLMIVGTVTHLVLALLLGASNVRLLG